MNKIILCFVISIVLNVAVNAQSIMSNTVTIHAKNQKLHEVLTIIGNESNITFSYNTKSINRDTLVTVNANNKPLSEVLRMIFNASYEFKESGSYIIIRRKPLSTTNIISKSQSMSEYYSISGYIIDDETGDKIPDATIYEKQHLISSLTDENGYFILKLKNKYPSAKISVSKANYIDTSIDIKSKFNQKVSIALSRKPIPYARIETETSEIVADSTSFPIVLEKEMDGDEIEKSWIGRVLLSSKQRIRSLNLKKFYTTRAYQFSFVPGLSTHGKMNAQVISKTSINLIGGYSGGVDIVEIGGVFNIVKRNVKSVQIAGAFNVVGGDMKGVQVSSLFNQVGHSMHGVQISGLVNNVKEEVQGIQIASLYNKAKSIKGLQIGFINVTESNEGTSIGLINISKGKKHRRVGFILRLPRKAIS